MNTDVESPDVDDVPEDYPVPEPIEVPDDDDFTPDDGDEDVELSVQTRPGWCGAVDTYLMRGDNVLLDGDEEVSTFLKIVKHPGFDAFVKGVRSGAYDEYIKD